MIKGKIQIGNTRRRHKRPAIFWVDENDPEKESGMIPECHEEKPIIEETGAEEKVSSEITPTYNILWDEDKTCVQIIKIIVSDKNFLKAILKELDKNLKSETKFEWSPLAWSEDPKYTTINAIAKINKNNVAELKKLIDKIK